MDPVLALEYFVDLMRGWVTLIGSCRHRLRRRYTEEDAGGSLSAAVVFQNWSVETGSLGECCPSPSALPRRSAERPLRYVRMTSQKFP